MTHVSRFRATIHKQGPNPYVDVPERVTRAFARYARAGRITVEGRLNGASMRAVLIPRGRAGHRLYVNGGMRSRAGVKVGDTVTFELRPTRPGVVRPPGDVTGALRRVKGAAAAFGGLSPSHRRELLRYIDDARTPETRDRRIRKAIDHALGDRVSAATGEPAATLKPADTSRRPLWTCPHCGSEFVNRNQYHSCRRYDIDHLFTGKPALVRDLFERFRELVRACGPVKELAYRDHVGYMVRVRFAGAVPRSQWLDVGFWVTRRIEHRRIRKIETLYPDAHIHVVRVTRAEELDRELAGWLQEAYAVGRQEHLRR